MKYVKFVKYELKWMKIWKFTKVKLGRKSRWTFFTLTFATYFSSKIRGWIFFFFLFSFNSWKVCQIMIAFPVAFARLDKRESTKPQMSRSVMFNAFVFSVLEYFIFCQILQMNTISTISFIFGIIERRMIFSHNFHSKFNKFLKDYDTVITFLHLRFISLVQNARIVIRVI